MSLAEGRMAKRFARHAQLKAQDPNYTHQFHAPDTASMGRAAAFVWIYFVQTDQGGPIKIGCAWDVEKRVREMQMHCPYPMRVLARMEGTRRKERELHYRFAHLHEHGEWFRPEPDLLAFIDSHKEGT